jgi:hypothetical protein
MTGPRRSEVKTRFGTPAPPGASAAASEEVVAIVAAIEELWPRAAVGAADEARRASVWRFSGRWWSQPVPLRRPRPWT